jgi:phenylpropionate dioxygenase-like ring-hydroxylating dioxygenase large terminal subunit
VLTAEFEMLRHAWLPVARIEDVHRDGVVQANILGTDLVVYGTGKDTTVAQGHCPHRGMALWLGEVVDGCLQCPYHGWLFEGGSGRCTHVPSLPPGADPARTSLRTHPVRLAYGHVWSCLDEPSGPLPDLPDTRDGAWRFAYGEPADVACGLRQITENFRDMAHFAFVHIGSMGPNVRREVDPYTVERDEWTLNWTLSTDLGGTALDGNAGVANGQTLDYRVALPGFTSVRTSFVDGGHRLVAQFAAPISRDGLRVRHFWLVGFDDVVADQHGVTMPEMVAYERLIFEEDFAIVQNQWPVEAPLDAHSQAHTRADRVSLVYRRAYRELIERFAEPDRRRGSLPPAVAVGTRPAGS